MGVSVTGNAAKGGAVAGGVGGSGGGVVVVETGAYGGEVTQLPLCGEKKEKHTQTPDAQGEYF